MRGNRCVRSASSGGSVPQQRGLCGSFILDVPGGSIGRKAPDASAAEVNNCGIADLAFDQHALVKPLSAQQAAFGLELGGGGDTAHDDAETVEDQAQEEDDEGDGERGEHGSI